MSQARQELHNYLQDIYRNSDSLQITTEQLDSNAWKARVFSASPSYMLIAATDDFEVYNQLVAEATANRANAAKEAAAAQALAIWRGY